jgi:hypothetical protein
VLVQNWSYQQASWAKQAEASKAEAGPTDDTEQWMLMSCYSAWHDANGITGGGSFVVSSVVLKHTCVDCFPSCTSMLRAALTSLVSSSGGTAR